MVCGEGGARAAGNSDPHGSDYGAFHSHGGYPNSWMVYFYGKSQTKMDESPWVVALFVYEKILMTSKWTL